MTNRLCWVWLICAVVARAGGEPAGLAFFEKEVRPILVEHCYECHSGTKTKGGLSLETRKAWSEGGDSGPAIVPGKPDESLMIQAVRYGDADLAMPPEKAGGKLTAPQIAALEAWVRMGAPDPREAGARIAGMDAEEARTWWAFQQLPAAGSPGTSAQIDAFIDAGLSAAAVQPSSAADKRTLIRRATFDLTGLPPSAEEVDAFLADHAPDAFVKLTERLLASPGYGEKWGRHWLDVVRYADSLDSRGSGAAGDILDAWRYRDWVVDALNRDLPYDQFIVHQLAGDILASREWDPKKLVATTMYAIGHWGNGDADKEKVYTDIVDDQIDVTGRAFLGLTLACARCHDHKFDPVTTRDYYGLAGSFFSSRILESFAAKTDGEKLMRIPLLSPAENAQREQTRQRLEAIDAELFSALAPFTEVKPNVAGVPGLTAWHGKAADLPSLFINGAGGPVAFATIKLPAGAVAVHPGQRVAASAVWRSPIAGVVRVAVQIQDADPVGGDGIVWFLRHGDTLLRSGQMKNGSRADVEDISVTVSPGDLLGLTIRPGADYTCDTTQIGIVIRNEHGARWDLGEALVRGAKHGQDDPWWICSGEGGSLKQDSARGQALAAERQRLGELFARTDFTQGLQEGGIPKTGYEGFHDAAVHQRGRYDQLGEKVPRGIPAFLARAPVRIGGGSGRHELAQWIASSENPLTARVMANRIWQHHFGHGLVRTANNFGKLGTPPTHPALLDWLASEFIRGGWSMKHLHRLIMGSAVYQRSASASPRALQADPDNHLLAHQYRRRLTAEELRDAMLQAAGRLSPTLGGKSSPDILAPRRTLYLTTVRSDRSSYQALFDGADPTAIVEQRTESTVAPQSLFLLNSPFVLAQAEALAAASAASTKGSGERVRWLWRRLFQREPGPPDEALEIGRAHV